MMKGGRKNLKKRAVESSEDKLSIQDGQSIMQVVSLRGSNLIEVLLSFLFACFLFCVSNMNDELGFYSIQYLINCPPTPTPSFVYFQFQTKICTHLTTFYISGILYIQATSNWIVRWLFKMLMLS